MKINVESTSVPQNWGTAWRACTGTQFQQHFFQRDLTPKTCETLQSSGGISCWIWGHFQELFAKKCFFFCRHQKLEVRFFWSMSFGCGSVFFFSNIQVTKFSPSPKLLGRWIFLYQNAMILIQSRGGGNSSNLKTPGLSNLSVPRAPWGWICPILLQLACLCGSIWPWMPKNEEEQRWHGTKLEVLMLWSWQRTIVH